MRPQPLICVRDVEASSQWYRRLLGCDSAHGGPNYERLVSDGRLVLQLHRWEEEHHHGRIGEPVVFHAGWRRWFPFVSEAISKVVPLDRSHLAVL